MTTTTHQDINALLTGQGTTRRIPTWARWVIGLLIVAAGAWVLATRARSASANAVPAYITEAVVRGNLEVKVSATGNLQPTNTVDVGSELSGLVDQVFVDENDQVRRGQLLLQLDQSRLKDQIVRSEATLASADARLAQADAALHQATASLGRLQEVSRLSGGKVPSATEMETAEANASKADADRNSAVAGVTEARAALNTDRTNLSKSAIRSPVDGIVLKRSVEPGQTVAATLQVATLFQIAEDLRQMELEVHVDEADIGRTTEGQRASFTVDAYPSRVYDADVVRVAFGSTKSGDVVSYATVLRVKNDDLSLRPGMTASAEIASASVTDALLVPNAALRFAPASAQGAPGRSFVSSLMPGPPRQQATQPETTSKTSGQVWVVRDGQAVAVPVVLGETNGRFTQVTGGDLQEGASVITDSGTAQS